METERPRQTTIALDWQTDPIASAGAMRHRVTISEFVRAVIRYADTFDAVAHGEIRHLLAERTKARLIVKENLIKDRAWSAAAKAVVEKWANGSRMKAARRELAAKPEAARTTPAESPALPPRVAGTGRRRAAKNAFSPEKLNEHHRKYPGGLP